MSTLLLAASCGGSGHTRTYVMPAESMAPTIHKGDLVVTKRPVGDVKRGDVVAFQTPRGTEQACGVDGTFIKRVIALPGETWSEQQGYVYINGKRLNESYVTPAVRDFQTHPTRKIPRSRYFLMGDNRSASCDSRLWGTVPRASLLGKVVKIKSG